MAELGKIEKPQVASFKANRKLYVVPTLPFEELALELKLDRAKVERFWEEVREKVDYFASTYGNIGIIYVEGLDEGEQAGMDFFEKFGKDSNHYKFIKSLVDRGAKLKGIDKEEYIRRSKLLFEEYSKSFLPDIKEIHEGFYGKEIDFEKWRGYIVQKIQEIQAEMDTLASKLVGEMPENTSGVITMTDGRAVEFPQGMDIFQIRPPAFDDVLRNIRDLERA